MAKARAVGERNVRDWHSSQLEDQKKKIEEDVKKERKPIKQEEEREIAHLGTYLKELEKAYPGSRPINLRKDKLTQIGKQLATFFSQIRGRIAAVIKGQVRKEKHIFAKDLTRLSYLFGPSLTTKAKKAQELWKKIETDQDKIIAELDEVVKYWQYVEDKGKLPGWPSSLRRFNKKLVERPMDEIKQAHLDLMKEMDEVFTKELQKMLKS